MTSNPAGINCGTDCSEAYGAGANVNLTATPASGWQFAGWSGACTGTGACAVSMTAAKSVTATFALNKYALTVAKAGTGQGTVTSAPTGINCGADCGESYNHGTAVALTASPAAGSTFAGWSGACTGTGACAVSMTAAKSVTATFVPLFALTVAKNGSGTVTSNPAGINCGTDCSEAYGAGANVNLTATPASGWQFAGWSGACTGTGTCSVAMNAAKSVAASFTSTAATLRVTDASKAEGNTGTTPFTFTVTLSPASASTVTVKYATANGTAAAGSDYTAVPATLLTFAPGQTSKTVMVNGLGDTMKEANETFVVNLSSASGGTIADSQGVGTILNDDGPLLRINDVSKAEGNTGATAFTFTVTLSPASTGPVTVKYATANGTATAGGDYTATSGTLTFTPGQTSKTVTVNVTGNTTVETNEAFAVNLSGAVGATLFDGQGVGTILNDD